MTFRSDDATSSPCRFATTRWSLVVAAGQRESPEGRAALEELCRTYWYPLYAYLRRRGSDAHEAQDLTQAFLTQLVAHDRIAVADPNRGRFRSFLLGSLNHFVANERRYAAAEKRGGGHRLLSVDVQRGEQRYASEPPDAATAESLFERRWALTVLERALDRLREDYTSSGKRDLYETLLLALSGVPLGENYRDVAARFGMTEGAIKVTVHRMRRRCRELIRDEIRQTVCDESQVEEELRQLFSALRSEKNL